MDFGVFDFLCSSTQPLKQKCSSERESSEHDLTVLECGFFFFFFLQSLIQTIRSLGNRSHPGSKNVTDCYATVCSDLMFNLTGEILFKFNRSALLIQQITVRSND